MNIPPTDFLHISPFAFQAAATTTLQCTAAQLDVAAMCDPRTILLGRSSAKMSRLFFHCRAL
jgi:hypothetical protein